MTYSFAVNIYGNQQNQVIDRNNLANPILHHIFLHIKNQSTVTLYFKVILDVGEWDIESPTNGELGSVGSGSEAYKELVITRSRPSSDVVESGTLTIECYTDSGYTNRVGLETISLTISIVDLESMTEVTIFDFDEGDTEGWSGVEISDLLSVEPTGYSAYIHHYKSSSVQPTITGTLTGTASRSVTLPNRNKVYLSFYFTLRQYQYLGHWSRLTRLEVYVNGELVHTFVKNIQAPNTGTWSTLDKWYKIGMDLSKYKGQNVVIVIKTYVYYRLEGAGSTTCDVHLDRIVIGGSD